MSSTTLRLSLTRASRLALAAAAIALQGLAQAALPVTSGLTLQLEADTGLQLDSGGNVLAWSDQSGAGHGASGLPGWYASMAGVTMNGIAVPTFSDSTLLLTGQPVASPQFTLFAVASTVQNASADGFRELLSNWSWANTLGSVFLGTVGNSGLPSTTVRFTDAVGGATDPAHPQTGVGSIANPAAGFVLGAVSGATSASVYLGGNLLASTGALPARNLGGDWYVGSQGGNFEFWQGSIGALLVYDRALDSAERAAVTDYLSQKYLGVSAVPEPSAWLLLAAGGLVLVAAARRRHAA